MVHSPKFAKDGTIRSMRIISLNVGLPSAQRYEGRKVITGGAKKPVPRAVLCFGNLDGDQQAEEWRTVAGRLEHVFEVVRNPKTGEPYTNAVVARMTLGELSEEEVQRVRTGADSDPTVVQVAALAGGVFGVEPSCLLDRGEPSLLDDELVRALRDEDVRDITRESSRLPERERQLVLGIVRQSRDQNAAPSG
jgi:hypothetical protein